METVCVLVINNYVGDIVGDKSCGDNDDDGDRCWVMLVILVIMMVGFTINL